MEKTVFTSIVELFESQVECSCERIAVSDQLEALSYAGLNTRANHLAEMLENNSPVIISIFLERKCALVVAMLATLKSNQAYLLIDTTYPQSRIQHCIKESNSKIIITTKALKQKILLNDPDSYQFIFIEDILWPAQKANPVNIRHADSLVYVIFTSGTTGLPKGILIESQSLSNIILDFKNKLHLDVNDKFLSVTSPGFDIFALEIFLPLISGSHCILYERGEVLNAEDLKAFIESTQPSIMQATPSLWNLLADIGLPKANNMRILTGGENLSPTLASSLLSAFKNVYNVYGPTETTIWSTFQTVTDPHHITISKAIANTSCYVFRDDFISVNNGEAGELYIGGIGLARGYLNNNELTDKCFITHPQTGKRLYKTGDLVKQLDSQEFIYIGRIDHQIKINGNRLELEEIENIVLTLPFIQQVILIVKATEKNEIILFYIMNHLASTYKDHESQILEILERWLPKSTIPAHILQIENFPLNNNGKIDRHALEKIFDQRVTPALSWLPSVEQTILGIWQEVLKLNQIDRETHFVNLGGNSIHIPQIILKLNQTFKTRVTIRTFMENQTIKQLAELIKQLQPALI